MPYLVYCLDRPDAGDLRQRTRAEHLEYMIAHQDLVLYGGPMQSDDGQTVFGSVMVLDAPSRAQVDAFLADEPYSTAQLFSECRITRLRQMVPENPPGLLLQELARELRISAV